MNIQRNVVLALLFTALVSLFGVAAPAQAAGVHVSLGVRVGALPPPLRHEVVVVRPGPGYVWVNGYWDWRPAARDYVWVPGRWARPPHRHSVWVGPHYVTSHHHHYYRRGYWRR